MSGQANLLESGHIELVFATARVVIHGQADLPTLRGVIEALRP